ncbi:TRAP transporter large permease [Elioraea sp. Yellowstone]|jgi:tripartite ATP-independent transporter DctM subunit|uniref:TRAP transporter large permease n=1 Tax=Elioraea sp. Yellowstone TaxID=2592070 RepID=UPI00115377EB|nr:TRAP transporter large permease [Elioraea sp. Yellowstone]TQF84479.1 TRAP transporter large permease [Elioraea sp. Yellowstone]
MSLALFGLSFVLALLAGMPVAIVLGISSAVYILAADLPLAVIPQKMFAGMDSFVLLSIPAFVLAGNIMNGGGITDRIIRFSNAIVGHLRGGLAQTNIVGSMIFAGISGTAAADAASQGAVLIPGMARVGYPVPYAAAVTAASAVVGPMIPPSVPMIIVGSLTGISVGQMFLAGAVPGVLLGLGMMVPAYLLAVRDNHPREAWKGWCEVWLSFRDAVWAMAMMGLVLFGIVGGFFTPTEAAVIAVIYAAVVGLFVYRELSWRHIPKLIADSAISGAAIMVLVGFANVFGWILASERVPQLLTDGIMAISSERWAVLILMNLLLLVVGMFMETIAALIILFPPLLAVATSVGIDPVHFATFGVLNLMIGLSTPPVGVCLFICASIARISIAEITRAVWPFLASNLVVLALVTAIPGLSLWLPGLFYR